MEKIFCKLLPMFIMLTMFQIVMQQYSKRGGDQRPENCKTENNVFFI